MTITIQISLADFAFFYLDIFLLVFQKVIFAPNLLHNILFVLLLKTSRNMIKLEYIHYTQSEISTIIYT